MAKKKAAVSPARHAAPPPVPPAELSPQIVAAVAKISAAGLIQVARDTAQRCRLFCSPFAPNVQIRAFQCHGGDQLSAFIYRNGRDGNPELWKMMGDCRIFLHHTKPPVDPELAMFIARAQEAAEAANMPAVYIDGMDEAALAATLPSWFFPYVEPPLPLPEPPPEWAE